MNMASTQGDETRGRQARSSPQDCTSKEGSPDLKLSSYWYDLPEGLIAQKPLEERSGSRLMVLDRFARTPPRHRHFTDLLEELPEGALLVANNSRVLPARLKGIRHTGGKVEFLLLSPLPTVLATADLRDGQNVAPAEGLLRCGGHPTPGEVISFGPNIAVRLLSKGDFGRWQVELSWTGDLALDFEEEGSIPLPPYIRRDPHEGDKRRYQTVYARVDRTGSVAAPTAGLHFTEELGCRLLERGFGWAEVTLYVGYGTFSPVRCEDIRDHDMHAELVDVPGETVEAIARAKAEKRPVIAVGTTTVRALEGAYRAMGALKPFQGETSIFLYPGKTIHVVDGLVTNFHLPCSTLVMLVSAFTGRERVLSAYAEAVREGYRFFSYGDAMFIRP